MTTVGICSLWWNHQEMLPEFLRMMKVGGWDKLVLVDNASTPEANAAFKEAVKELGPKASGLRMGKNSVLHGWNAGMNALGTDIVIQMANDVVQTDVRWLEWGIEGMGPGVIQGPLCWYRGIVYVDGSMCAYMREDWERLGGLDAEYYEHPGYWSDTDICLKAQRMGMTVRPTLSGLLHLINYSGGNGPQYNTPNTENMKKFVARYLEPVFIQRPIVLRSQPEASDGPSDPVQPVNERLASSGALVCSSSE